MVCLADDSVPITSPCIFDNACYLPHQNRWTPSLPRLPQLSLHHSGWIDAAEKRSLQTFSAINFTASEAEVGQEALWEEGILIAFQAVGVTNPWHFLYDDLLSLHNLLYHLASLGWQNAPHVTSSIGESWQPWHLPTVLLFAAGSRRVTDIFDAVMAWGKVIHFDDLNVAGATTPRCFRRLAAGIPAGLVRQSAHRLFRLLLKAGG